MMTRRLSRILTASALSLALLTGAAQGADMNPYTGQVIQQLAGATRAARNTGFILLDAVPGRLYSPDWTAHILTLEAGREYLIAGACDGDCRDMDLAILDPSGRRVIVDRDTGRDDLPLVAIRPQRSGEFTLAVSIPDCRARRCTYGVALYGRAATEAPPIKAPPRSAGKVNL